MRERYPNGLGPAFTPDGSTECPDPGNENKEFDSQNGNHFHRQPMALAP